MLPAVQTGYFGVGFKPRGYHGPLYTAGYPGDKPLWSFWTIDSNTSCVVEDDNGLDTVLVGGGKNTDTKTHSTHMHDTAAVLAHV